MYKSTYKIVCEQARLSRELAPCSGVGPRHRRVGMSWAGKLPGCSQGEGLFQRKEESAGRDNWEEGVLAGEMGRSQEKTKKCGFRKKGKLKLERAYCIRNR